MPSPNVLGLAASSQTFTKAKDARALAIIAQWIIWLPSGLIKISADKVGTISFNKIAQSRYLKV